MTAGPARRCRHRALDLRHHPRLSGRREGTTAADPGIDGGAITLPIAAVGVLAVVASGLYQWWRTFWLRRIRGRLPGDFRGRWPGRSSCSIRPTSR